MSLSPHMCHSLLTGRTLFLRSAWSCMHKVQGRLDVIVRNSHRNSDGRVTGVGMAVFPFFVQGKVVKGFGRGSKQLGIPTANFPEDVVDSLPKDFTTGVYYGWASIDDGSVHKMVLSVGWNPFYHNTKRSMETYIMHKFKDDFYDSLLKLCLLGYIRPEKSFDNLDELIAAIKADIQFAEEALEQPDMKQYFTDNFFKPLNHTC